MLTVGSLFSGIGGFELGLERAGMRVRWQAEIDPYASAVLAQHWPGVRNFGDVRNVRAGTAERVDVVCGGFPCQDISSAGKGAGIDGARSGLWREFARVVGELRPRYVLVENVPTLRSRGLGRVLGDLAALGFDAEWHCISAADVGAPHRRDRIWIIAHAIGVELRHQQQREPGRFAHRVPHEGEAEPRNDGASQPLADAARARQQEPGPLGRGVHPAPFIEREAINAFNDRVREQWSVEPDVGGVAHGLPAAVD